MSNLVFPNLSSKVATEIFLKMKDSEAPLTILMEEVDKLHSSPNLGVATTGQMLDEIKARVDCNYSTVFYEAPKPPSTAPRKSLDCVATEGCKVTTPELKP